MAGQAVITIGENQWSVGIATTPDELSRGLGGMPGIPPDTGMLFDLGREQIISVTTEPMFFPLDICFLSGGMVVTGIHRAVDTGHVLTSAVPARYFLEVNAGEFEGVGAGDRALLELLPLGEIPVMLPDRGSLMFPFLGLVMIGGFMAGMVERVTTDNPGPTPEWEEGQRIAADLGQGVVYNGPQFANEQFVYHTFTDTEVTGTTFGARNLEEARAALREKRRLFGAPLPSFPEGSATEPAGRAAKIS